MSLDNHYTPTDMRTLAEVSFSRAAGAPLIEGNSVRLLKDARENYPAWLDAIGLARHHVHFESYIIHEDSAGRRFGEALIDKARQGVQVRLIYDWMGGFGKTSRRFWNRLRSNGVQVRCYNPPRFDSPFGWLSRDHRKMIAVDGRTGFVSGLCVGQMWEGIPEKNIDPWRDTGVEIRGPAVAALEEAFAEVWAMTGEPIPKRDITEEGHRRAGTVSMRLVASVPARASMLRLDEIVASVARNRLWLTDAYYVGVTTYVQALSSAARDGVDVRLLVPNGTDIPLLRPLSRAGYRPLLQSGVRIFEWNGTMVHAKTAAADGHWARVGSTNLNPSSWIGNCELDAVVEDETFALAMEEMYLQDLKNATEVVLDAKQKIRAPGEPSHRHPVMTSGGGSGGRVAAGAIRIGNAVGAAFTGSRILEPVEARVMTVTGLLLLLLATLFVLIPRAMGYPLLIVFAWLGVTLLYRAYKLYQGRDAMGVKKTAR